MKSVHPHSNIKTFTPDKFQNLVDNLIRRRNIINDNENHHFALFFKDGKLKWLEKGGYWRKHTIM